MSISKPPMGTHFSDGVRVGPILGTQYIAGTGAVPSPASSQPPGIYDTPISLLDIVPAAEATANIASLQNPAGAGYLTLLTASNAGITWMSSYQGTSGPGGAGVLALDVPRNVTITGITNTVTVNLTIFGWDQYGMPMVETIAGPVGATTADGVKAWKYIQAIYASATPVQNISVGVGSIFGLPYYSPDPNYMITQNWAAQYDAGTFQGGIGSPATATTGDVRGTYQPTTAADGATRLFMVFYNPSGDIRKYNSSVSGTIYLGTNPLTITNTTNIMTVLSPGHAFTNGENVTIAGSATIGNITAAQINITAPITVINADQFTYVFSGAAATSTTTAGGAGVTMTPGKGNLYQVPQGRFGVPQYTRVLF